MPKYFTLAQAQLRIPAVDHALRDALAQKSAYQSADSELNSALQKIRISGGSVVRPGPILALRARRDAAAAALKTALDTIEEAGALVKDLDIGLIDFLTLYHGREVCLCWKLGEDRIAFWHGPEEGFRGRKPIDEDFLAHHRGDRAH